MRDHFSIRAASSDDAEEVTALLQVAYPRLMAASYTPEQLRALEVMTQANPKLLQSGTFYVVQNEQGRVVACGGWTCERPGNGGVEEGLAHIRHFATHPDFTRQGLGRMTFEQCQNAASAIGIAEFECYASLNAELFYRSLGFVAVKPIDVPMPNGVLFPGLLMRWPAGSRVAES